MARVQPVLSDSETALVDQMASMTRTKRTDVVKNALAVYSWFLRQAVTGAQVVARKPSGEEVALETADLAALSGRGQALTPSELGVLSKQLAATTDPAQAARLRERLARGFYGI